MHFIFFFFFFATDLIDNDEEHALHGNEKKEDPFRMDRKWYRVDGRSFLKQPTYHASILSTINAERQHRVRLEVFQKFGGCCLLQEKHVEQYEKN